MESEPVHTVSLGFDDCEAGWIRFTVCAAGQSVHVHASHLYDPFPDLLSWMHAILAGVQQCSFLINEEGQGKELVAIRKSGARLLFVARDPENRQEFIRALVERRQLIDCFYSRVRAFAQSPRYQSEEWECLTLMDRFREASPALDDGRLIDHLIELGREELKKLLFRVAPSYEVSFPEEPTQGDELVRFYRYVVEKDNPHRVDGMVRRPAEWAVPSDYDAWGQDERTQFVLMLLRERENAWGGCKLTELESPSIERYLSNPEPDDGPN